MLVNDKLYYFEKENSKEPAGFLTLDRKGKQNCFAVKTNKRTYLISAESVAEADDWIRVLAETAHGRTTTAAAPLKPIAKKKKDLRLARHVLLTKNCGAFARSARRRLRSAAHRTTLRVVEALKKTRRDEIEELNEVATLYLEASQNLTVIGKQLCDALLKISSSTQNHDVGEALKDVALHQKQMFLQRARGTLLRAQSVRREKSTEN